MLVFYLGFFGTLVNIVALRMAVIVLGLAQVFDRLFVTFDNGNIDPNGRSVGLLATKAFMT